MADQNLQATAAADVPEAEHTRTGPVYRPNVDIVERGDELVVLADMPGVTREDIDIRFEKGTLTIHGKAKPRQAEGTNYLLREYAVGDFHRTFQISEHIDAGRIHAESAGGVLVLHLPKAEAVKPRKIAVTSS